MNREDEKNLMESEIESLNEEINHLAYMLRGLLNVDCSFGVCVFDPEVENVQDKMKEVQEKKALLEHLKRHIDSCWKD